MQGRIRADDFDFDQIGIAAGSDMPPSIARCGNRIDAIAHNGKLKLEVFLSDLPCGMVAGIHDIVEW